MTCSLDCICLFKLLDIVLNSIVLCLLQSWNVLQDKSSTDTKLAHSVSTREAITGGLFWAKWGTLLCVGLLMSFLGSYQKTYGQGYHSRHLFHMYDRILFLFQLKFSYFVLLKKCSHKWTMPWAVNPDLHQRWHLPCCRGHRAECCEWSGQDHMGLYLWLPRLQKDHALHHFWNGFLHPYFCLPPIPGIQCNRSKGVLLMGVPSGKKRDILTWLLIFHLIQQHVKSWLLRFVMSFDSPGVSRAHYSNEDWK